MWDISPSLVRYDVAEPTSNAVSLLGLKQLSSTAAGSKAQGVAFTKPIANFYQTDVISRASVTMAQCTRSFVKGENYGFSQTQSEPQAAIA